MRVLTIGRLPDNDIVINDNSVSRKHCQIISYDNGTYELVDFSSYGTIVSGKRIHHARLFLSVDDTMIVGNQRLNWVSYFTMAEKNTVYPGLYSPSQDHPHSLKQYNPIPPMNNNLVNVPGEININKREEYSYVNKKGDDFSVKFNSTLGDTMGSTIGSTLGCIVSIILFILFFALIGIML